MVGQWDLKHVEAGVVLYCDFNENVCIRWVEM